MPSLFFFFKGCNNAKSLPNNFRTVRNIFKLQLFPIQLNPLCSQGKSNWTGSLCQLFPMSQNAHSSPQHFSSLVQCTLYSIPEPRRGSLSLTPQQPCPLLPTPSTSLLQSPHSSQHIHLLLPHFTIQQRGRKEREEKAAEKGGRKRTWWVISAGHRLDMYTRNETGLKIQGGRPQKPCDGLAQWKSVMSYWWLKVSIALVFSALEHTKQKI